MSNRTATDSQTIKLQYQYSAFSLKQADERWIDDVTRRFHQRTGFYPDSEEVIRQLREYRQKELIPARKGWMKKEVKKRAFERFAITEVIRLICEDTDEDPVRILTKFRSDVDDMIACSEHSNTWYISCVIFDTIRDFMEWLS